MLRWQVLRLADLKEGKAKCYYIVHYVNNSHTFNFYYSTYRLLNLDGMSLLKNPLCPPGTFCMMDAPPLSMS